MKISAVLEQRHPFTSDALVDTGYQKLLDAPDGVAQAATLERKGGPCPFCGVAFGRIEVDNKFGKFAYYQPACHCFKRCMRVQLPHGHVTGCERWMVTEKLVGIDYCTQCYGQPPGTKTKASRVHKRAYGGKDAAAGEKSE